MISIFVLPKTYEISLSHNAIVVQYNPLSMGQVYTNTLLQLLHLCHSFFLWNISMSQDGRPSYFPCIGSPGPDVDRGSASGRSTTGTPIDFAVPWWEQKQMNEFNSVIDLTSEIQISSGWCIKYPFYEPLTYQWQMSKCFPNWRVPYPDLPISPSQSRIYAG